MSANDANGNGRQTRKHDKYRDRGTQADDWQPREHLGPLPGHELERWPEIGDPDRFRNRLVCTAEELGREGCARREVLGKGAPLRRVIDEHVNVLEQDARIAGLERTRNAARENSSALILAQLPVAEAGELDAEADELDERADEVEERLAEARAREEEISPGRRGGRFQGKEAATAAVGAGVVDATTFTLTISGVGGALWLRIMIATGITLAYTVIVFAAGRTLASLGRRLADASAKVVVPVLLVLLAALFGLAGNAIFSAGGFRDTALDNLLDGEATAPGFLVWIQCATALAAVVAIAWWHLAAEGERRLAAIAALETEVADLRSRAQAARAAARDARERYVTILAGATESFSDQRFDHELTDLTVARIRATGERLWAFADTAFLKGVKARERERAGRREPRQTMSEEWRRGVEQLVEEIRGGGAPAHGGRNGR